MISYCKSDIEPTLAGGLFVFRKDFWPA
jgi:hypothetical protein